jgi:hypothetical protein
MATHSLVIAGYETPILQNCTAQGIEGSKCYICFHIRSRMSHAR